MVRKLWPIVLVVMVCGCSHGRAIILQPDISPQNPKLVVIPNWPDRQNVEFANKVEAAILRAGVSVLERPGLKFRETTKTSGAAESAEHNEQAHSAKNAIEERIIEVDWDAVYNESKADYVAITYSAAYGVEVPLIRIVRRDEKRVVASIPINGFGAGEDPYTSSFTEQKVYASMYRLGLTKTKTEYACPKLDRQPLDR